MGGWQATITNTRHEAGIADQSSSVEDSKHANAEETEARATGITVSSLVEVYRAERMPQRFSTRYSYDQWLTNHILPHWGEGSITDVKPRPVELWLHSLTLSPKSRVHIRGFCIKFGSSLCGAVMCRQSAIR